ncbi:hypothetical protein MJ257_13895 [Paenibacillus timonensis]|jgi:hypothetical protein|uniref:Uncharacterized protein n=2 Tax=Paenibacillus timonensis TaxID=225915 RepID=A0ABW3SDM4_9BACL|nr:hypothetical protein [Paenibacillus timonensis]GJM79475.1 hypothetical protein HMSSN139_19710 [Paenibacillus sp. HMSSN-139]
MAEMKQRPFIFVTIKASTIRNILILDLIAGTGLYYLIKLATASVLLGTMGSALGTEAMKRIPVTRLIQMNRGISPVKKG